MTALFFLPPTAHPGPHRRVDVAHLASLFAAPEEVERVAPSAGRPALRLAVLALILLGAVGDMVFVAKPAALSSCVGIGRSLPVPARSALDQA